MSALSIPAIVLASISFYVGFYHLILYLRRKQHLEDLFFAILCQTTCLYDIFCAGLYSAVSTTEGVEWQRAQFIVLAFFVPAFIWFVSAYTHQKPGMAVYTLTIFFLLAALIQITDRSSLTWITDSASIKRFLLPFGIKVTIYEATLGLFTTIQSLMGMVASTYILWMGIRYYRRGYKREAVPLLIALGFVYLAAINDTAISNGLYQFVYLIEYAYMAMILLMAYSLSSTVVEAAIAKEALRESEERFRALVETTSDWVWEVDQQGIYTYASPKARELLGYKPQEILGKTPFAFMPPDEAKRIRDVFQKYTAGQKPFSRLENTSRHKDGRLIVLETSGVPFFDSNGKLLGYRGIDRDITERKQAEEALRESEERLRQIASSLREVIWLRDAKTRQVLYVNPAYETLCGQPCESIYKNPDAFLDTIHPDDKPRIAKGVIGRVEEHRIIRPDGSIRWVLGRTFPVRNEAGEIYRITAILEDITERREAEEALRESETRYRTVVETSPDGIAVSDLEGKIIACNQQDAEMWGYEKTEELVGKSSFDLIAPEDRDRARSNLELTFKHGLTRNLEYNFIRRDGSRFIGELSVSLLTDNDGIPKSFVAITRDITQRKQAEEDVRQLNEELEARVAERTAQLESANKELEAFAYSVSHDLRAPLRAIDGYSRILLEDYCKSLDAEGRRICAVIGDSTRQMSRLIDDLLAFSRLSRVEMQSTPIDMEALARSVFLVLVPVADRARIEFRLSPLLPTVGDPATLHQVWVNLLANAVKFSSIRKRAVIEVGCQERGEEIVYFVRDNGAGFDMKYVSKLFGVFQRLHSAKEFEGTGVGLAIVQRVIQRHGGRVWAEGEEDKGASFYFSLPMHNAEEA
jgi:PAS domain S-box-containing protein